jgi:hypothetical protein
VALQHGVNNLRDRKIYNFYRPKIDCRRIASAINFWFYILSRDDRIRTYGILLPKQARYQAALHPVANSYVTTESAK